MLHVFTWQWYLCFRQTRRCSKCSHDVKSLFETLLGSMGSHDSDVSVSDKPGDVPSLSGTVFTGTAKGSVRGSFQVNTPWTQRDISAGEWTGGNSVTGFASSSQQEWTYAKYVRTLSFVDSTLAGCSLSGVVLTDRAVSLLSAALEVPRLAWRQKPFWFPSSAAGCSSWWKMTWFKLQGVLIVWDGQCMKIFMRLFNFYFKCQLWIWAYAYQCETSLTAVSYSQFLFCFFSTCFIVSIISFVGGSYTQGNPWIWCVQVCI